MSIRSAVKVDNWRRSAKSRPPAQRPRLPRVTHPSRPGGVSGPEVEGSVTSILEYRQRRDPRSPTRDACPTVTVQSRLRVPPAMPESDVRLTNRGLAVAMSLTIVVMVVALMCVATTAVRVTAEPAVAPVVEVARTAR